MSIRETLKMRGLSLIGSDKKTRQKIATVKKSEKKLLEIAAKQQRKLNNFLINTFMPSLDIKDGRIINTTNNLKKVNTAAKRERPGPAKYSYGKQTVENVNLNEAGDYEVAGVKGMKSKPFKKSFKTAEAREKWIEKNEDDIDELRFRDPK